MTTKLEYAPKGLIGVLTPQANTTVEPEFAILCPPGYAPVNARMVSGKASMEDRGVDYVEHIDTWIDQFANAPLDAVALGMTGPSYLIGREREDATVARVTEARGFPLVTTALAVCEALTLLNARTISLLSPYPASLTAKSAEYWTSRGFEVGEIVALSTDGDHFHPIYAMGSNIARTALTQVRSNKTDAIVMLGTGMPTLATLAECADWDGPPVLSSLFCLAWRSVAVAASRQPDRSDLEEWMSAKHWGDRLP